MKYFVSVVALAAASISVPAMAHDPVGPTVTFTVGASGTDPFTYQWLYNNIPLAVINRGALSATSGGVVLLSDFNTFDNTRLPLTNNRVLERNAIAYLTPEPSGFLLAIMGILTLVAGRRVRRSRPFQSETHV